MEATMHDPYAATVTDTSPVDVSIVILTFRRTHLLPPLLRRCAAQTGLDGLTTEIVVVDNNPNCAAAETVAMLARAIPALRYVSQTRRGISHARNAGVQAARGRLIAFVDDDEMPRPDWLGQLVAAQRAYVADVVFGPVLPVFVEPPERFRQQFEAVFTQTSHQPTGAPMARGKLLWFLDRKPACHRVMATNNTLIVRETCLTRDPPFNPSLGLTGGEDTLFFTQLDLDGRTLIWCKEAVVEETIPPDRMRGRYVLRYWFRSGQITSLTCVMTTPCCVGSLLRFMAAGAVQAVLYGSDTERGDAQSGCLGTCTADNGQLGSPRLSPPRPL
jgi:hypothetical protein